ncbi:hypothetical protein AQ750_04645 [Burkholderia pseudomallei]|nr:hypothetical protein AQ736_03365 [Burkholderia pseudomallei]OMS96428.1 hypothetical protein AQ750_04645 [Burkholderia pseudomallei]
MVAGLAFTVFEPLNRQFDFQVRYVACATETDRSIVRVQSAGFDTALATEIQRFVRHLVSTFLLL